MNFSPFTYFNKQNTPLVSFIGTTYSSASSTSYTFTNLNLEGSGLCVICVHAEVVGSVGRTVNSVTIAGASSSQAAQVSSGLNASGTTAAIFYIRQESSSATVVVNFNLAPARCLISVYRILNNLSDLPNQTRTAVALSGTGLSLAFTSLNADSVGVAAETIGLDTVSSVAWTNANLNYNVGSAPFGATRGTGANFTTTTSGNRTVSVSHTNSTQPIALAGAVWI